ncbi:MULTISPECIES: LuxR family transcriptional regulator [Microbacterium]|uniref:ATP-binding protein n=1 Tax=Microbacterium TaxID=33882 RepID=UPI0013A57FDB|nr:MULTISPECIES: LuxR family transcriptional regulator [Microbacterium]
MAQVSAHYGPDSLPPSIGAALVGRDRDLQLLRASLSHPPSLTVVEGEAGIGKSRLVRELVRDPALSGIRVLVGQCEQLHEPFPLGPVLDALSHAAGWIVPERLGAVAGALAPLMPELAHLLPPPPDPALDAGAARHQVFRAVAALLQHVGPVALVLEDAQWADSGTFDLLTFLAFHQPDDVAVLVTTRGGPLPIAEAFARAPAGPATLLTLAPLDGAEVQELARHTLGVELSASVAADLREKTGGVPFVLEEVLRSLSERLPERPDLLDRLAVPTALRDVMLQRLSGLDPVAREIVGIASVLSRRVDVELLAFVAERSPREVVDAVVSAQAVGVLQDEDDRPQFRHALAQQAVYESLPATSRRWLHARAAVVIAARPGPTPSARLAYHSKRAGNIVEFVRHAEQAADLAVARGDDSAAARFLLDVVESGAIPQETRLRVAARLGRVAIDGLAHAEAVPILTRLLEGGSLEPSLRGELRFALGRMLRQQGFARAGFEQIELALPDLGDQPALAARALAVLAVPENDVEVTVGQHLAWAELAERVARDSADPAVELSVRIAHASLLLEQGDPAALTLIDETRQSPAFTADPREHIRACLNWAQGHLHGGRVPRAEALLAEARDVVAQAGYVRVAGVVELVTHLTDFAAGRWEAIAERVDAFLDQPSEFGGAELDARLLQASLLAATGSAADAARALRGVIADAERLGAVWPLVAARATLARLMLAVGDPTAAVQQSATALELVRAKGMWAWGGEILQCLVEARADLGDLADAQDLVDELSDRTRGADAPLVRAAILTARAILAEAGEGRTAADLSAVERMLAEAVAALREGGTRVAEARAAERLGAFRLAQGDDSGAAVLESALAVFGELGARRDFSRVARTMREHGIALPARWRGGRRALGVELSEREREVAELAAAGLTNKEIAAELFLSLRTVESHMSKVLQKLGAPSRRELADALHGAIPAPPSGAASVAF